MLQSNSFRITHLVIPDWPTGCPLNPNVNPPTKWATCMYFQSFRNNFILGLKNKQDWSETGKLKVGFPCASTKISKFHTHKYLVVHRHCSLSDWAFYWNTKSCVKTNSVRLKHGKRQKEQTHFGAPLMRRFRRPRGSHRENSIQKKNLNVETVSKN